MNKPMKIIAVDDNLTNLSVLKNVLKPLYETYPVSSAAKMFDLLERIKPDLILLDVEMPELNGHEAMRLLKSNPAHKDIPVIFLTALVDEQDEMTGLELGAVDYIYKPFVAPLLLRRIETHLSLADTKRELQELNTSIQKKLIGKIVEVTELQNAILDIVADMVENRDETTGGHIHRIKKYLNCMIEALVDAGIYSDEICAWNMDFLLPSSQLHDVGKIAISDSILNKPGKLTDEEFEIMKTHSQIGADAIGRMEKNTKDSSFLKYAKIFASTHHERWDGKGYPNGLSGTNIPLEGRLMAVADVYDALVSVRPYKEAMSHEQAVKIILSGGGTQFDPQLTQIFGNIVSDQFAEIATISESV
ncbi:MAG: response regulator [Oscillospiraceae bacterium]|nr:response regulator [Oscillospiraceae bacterium]